VLKYACRLSFKQKADHRNVARALGLERLLYFPSLAKEMKKKIQIAITKVPEPIPDTYSFPSSRLAVAAWRGVAGFHIVYAAMRVGTVPCQSAIGCDHGVDVTVPC